MHIDYFFFIFFLFFKDVSETATFFGVEIQFLRHLILSRCFFWKYPAYLFSWHCICCLALPLQLFDCMHWDLFIPRLDFTVKPGSENSSRNDPAHFNLPPDRRLKTSLTHTQFAPSSEYTLIIHCCVPGSHFLMQQPLFSWQTVTEAHFLPFTIFKLICIQCWYCSYWQAFESPANLRVFSWYGTWCNWPNFILTM